MELIFKRIELNLIEWKGREAKRKEIAREHLGVLFGV